VSDLVRAAACWAARALAALSFAALALEFLAAATLRSAVVLAVLALDADLAGSVGRPAAADCAATGDGELGGVALTADTCMGTPNHGGMTDGVGRTTT